MFTVVLRSPTAPGNDPLRRGGKITQSKENPHSARQQRGPKYIVVMSSSEVNHRASRRKHTQGRLISFTAWMPDTAETACIPIGKWEYTQRKSFESSGVTHMNHEREPCPAIDGHACRKLVQHQPGLFTVTPSRNLSAAITRYAPPLF